MGDPITLMDLDPAITFVNVIVTFTCYFGSDYFSFSLIRAERLQGQVFSDMNAADCCI